MKWIEIITLRFLEKANRPLVDELMRQLILQKKSARVRSITVYRHYAVETDLSFHILWETEEQHPNKSPLGQQLSSGLNALGSLSYSIWVEAAAME